MRGSKEEKDKVSTKNDVPERSLCRAAVDCNLPRRVSESQPPSEPSASSEPRSSPARAFARASTCRAISSAWVRCRSIPCQGACMKPAERATAGHCGPLPMLLPHKPCRRRRDGYSHHTVDRPYTQRSARLSINDVVLYQIPEFLLKLGSC
jgi:hypothetical protein